MFIEPNYNSSSLCNTPSINFTVPPSKMLTMIDFFEFKELLCIRNFFTICPMWD